MQVPPHGSPLSETMLRNFMETMKKAADHGWARLLRLDYRDANPEFFRTAAVYYQNTTNQQQAPPNTSHDGLRYKSADVRRFAGQLTRCLGASPIKYEVNFAFQQDGATVE